MLLYLFFNHSLNLSMIRICLTVLFVGLNVSYLFAAEPKFKFTFGTSLGGIPLEINKVSKNIKSSPGVKINSWTFSPNFSSLIGTKKLHSFSENKISEDKVFIKFNLKF